jgi:uncharacterized membrane protein SpoIIM required for sporulation
MVEKDSASSPIVSHMLPKIRMIELVIVPGSKQVAYAAGVPPLLTYYMLKHYRQAELKGTRS